MKMLTSLQRHTLESDEGSMTYFATTMDPERVTILMLHPAFADHEIFVKQVEDFKGSYNLILPDFPGHGASIIKGSSLSLKMMPDLIKAILDRHNIDKVHVLGVSLGSLIGQGFADVYEDRILSLAIVGGYSIHKDNEAVLKAQGKEMLRWLILMLFSLKKFKRHLVDVSVRSDLGRKHMTSGVANITRKSILSMNGMNEIFRKTQEDKVYPVLVVVGEYDQPIAHDSAESLSLLPNATYSLIEGAGHCANIDNFQVFNSRYKQFINQY